MFEHMLIAFLILLFGRVLVKNWGAGALAASAWAISREVTQAEYRWIETFGSGLRANMPWWGGLDPRVWGKWDPWLDMLIPVTVSLVVAIVASRATGSAKSR